MATEYTYRKENRRVHYDRRRRTWIIQTLNPNHHNISDSETTGDRRAAMAFLRGKATTAAAATTADVPPRYKAFIAGNEHTLAFDAAYGRTAAAAIAAVKRKNSPDWRDCVVWAEELRGDSGAGGFGGEPCDL